MRVVRSPAVLPVAVADVAIPVDIVPVESCRCPLPSPLTLWTGDARMTIALHVYIDRCVVVCGCRLDQAMWAGVVFTSSAPNWDYTIRMNYTRVPDTSIAVNTLQVQRTHVGIYSCCHCVRW